MLATSMGCNPRSNNLDAASCRKSCHRRSLISSSISTRFQISLIAFAVVANTRPLNGLIGEPSGVVGQSALRTATALVDRGRTGGTPLFEVPSKASGKRIIRADWSIHSHCKLSNTACRKLVSIARTKALATYRLPLLLRAPRIRSNSSDSSRRLRARLPVGLRMFFNGLS